MRRSRLVLLLLLIGSLNACAGQTPGQVAAPAPPPQSSAHQSPEEALRARATKLWEARMKGDPVTQYELLVPKVRERVTLTGYARSRGAVIYQSYKIDKVEVAGDDGWVTATTSFRLNLPQASRFGPWDQRITMRWARVDGVWYILYDQQDVKQPVKAEEKQQ